MRPNKVIGQTKQNLLKDIITKGETTKAEFVKQFSKTKHIDHTNNKWFDLRDGKYYEFNTGNPDKKEDETWEQATDRHYASLPFYTQEHIEELQKQGVFVLIIT